MGFQNVGKIFSTNMLYNGIILIGVPYILSLSQEMSTKIIWSAWPSKKVYVLGVSRHNVDDVMKSYSHIWILCYHYDVITSWCWHNTWHQESYVYRTWLSYS